MKLIHIMPLGNLSYEYQQDMHMFLTHLVEKYPAYEEVARDCPGFKILDNSLIELGGSVAMERVHDAALAIGADEIVLPDVFLNGPKTIESVENALEWLREKYPRKNWPFRLMAVAHGANEQEWADCYRDLLEMPEIDTIGIPKILAKMHPQGRPYFVNTYCRLDQKDHHLLGLWYSFRELQEYKEPKLIRSCDTALQAFFRVNGLSSIWAVRPDGYTIDLEKETAPKITFQHGFALMLQKEVERNDS